MKLLKSFVVLIISLSLLLSAAGVLAQTQPLVEQETADQIQTQDQAFLDNAGLRSVSLGYVVAVVIRTLLSFLGIIFVLLIIYAGFLWMTAAGAEEKIGKAKAIMVSAIIGLVIVLSAYSITIFVLDNILNATGSGGGGGSSVITS